jgi:Holliday junction resolvasome RuvABC endonuclease subunit
VEIVGLDLSLTSTGFASSKESKAIQVKTKGVERLIAIETELARLIEPGSLICIEGYSFGSKNSQSHAIGELGGVVRRMLYLNNYRWVDIPPNSLKLFATGRGNASKNEVVSAISARTGLIWSGKGADDMCDAWVLRQMGLTHMGDMQYEWPKRNLESLEKVDWTTWDESAKVSS